MLSMRGGIYEPGGTHLETLEFFRNRYDPDHRVARVRSLAARPSFSLVLLIDPRCLIGRFSTRSKLVLVESRIV